MRFFVGTSGFSYPAWRGSFYPEGLPESKMLSFYAERLGAVEVNNSFYRMPSAKVLDDWIGQVPESFRFALKASQRITHVARLKEEAAGEALAYFWKQAEALGDWLGPILFQLPPNLKKDLPRLVAFLARLPPGCRAAFEFRHATWFDDEVFAALRDAKAALCVAEDEKLATPLVPTADWGYLRLRRQDYVAADIARWADAVKAQTWTETFVFFKHEDEGTGPALAKEMTLLLQA